MNTFDRGSPQVTSNWHLSRLFNMIGVSNTDVFCDLGCGYGNLCIFARRKVNRVFGFETGKYRYHRAKNKIKNANLDNIEIFQKSYTHKKSFPIIKKCNILFCTNVISFEYYQQLNKILRNNSYLLIYYLPPVPVIPFKKFGWYYIVKFPLQLAYYKNDWIKKVTNNTCSTELELFHQIRSDFYDWKNRIMELKKDLKRF
ncbi:MAG: methyltransferase domain-containing protein [Nitrosarchaeum sp.]|nr:methyltransferase domain-containing protein [Nitrosarchaeum sp.]